MTVEERGKLLLGGEALSGRPVAYNAGMAATSMKDLAAEAAAPSGLYRRDGYAWAKQQAEALRRRDLRAIDWDNVIEEIEAVGRAERKPWVSNCAQALRHMLVIEHCRTATPANLEDWEAEIGAFRGGMADAIDASHSLQGEYDEILAMAWKSGRREAVRRLAEYAAEAEGRRDRRAYLRAVDARLPDECPYLVEHVCPYDPKRDKAPRDDVWPPGVAAVLNAALDRNYEILRADSRSRAAQALSAQGGQ